MYELVDTKVGQKSACSNALVLKKKNPKWLMFCYFLRQSCVTFLAKESNQEDIYKNALRRRKK